MSYAGLMGGGGDDDDDENRYNRYKRDNPHRGDRIDAPLIDIDEEGMPIGYGLEWLLKSWEEGGGLSSREALFNRIRVENSRSPLMEFSGIDHVVRLAQAQRRTRATAKPTGRSYQRLALAQHQGLIQDYDVLQGLALAGLITLTREQQDAINQRNSARVRRETAKRQRR
jgi:hypothetical protein